MSRPLCLSDVQLGELRQAAASMPVELRSGLLQLVAGFLELEGNGASDAAFQRALRFAIEQLPAVDGASESCSG
jgi:hypothetical protein